MPGATFILPPSSAAGAGAALGFFKSSSCSQIVPGPWDAAVGAFAPVLEVRGTRRAMAKLAAESPTADLALALLASATKAGGPTRCGSGPAAPWSMLEEAAR